MRPWIKALPVAVGLPVVIGAASVKPEDAVSNLAAWAHVFGVSNVPDWLASPAADHRAIIAAVIISAIYVTAVWGIPLVRVYRLKESQIRNTLDELYQRSDRLFKRLILMPRDISQEQYQELQKEIDDWSRQTENYVRKHLGARAASKFIEMLPDDISTMAAFARPDPNYPASISSDRSATMGALNTMRIKLSRLIDGVK